jgi:NADP-dependent 3-hydroxy acid dehydrogenase YdfG
MHNSLYFAIDTSFCSKRQYEASLTSSHSGIGLETCILFAKEGANVLMADISAPALEKASAKLKQLVPSAHKVDIQVSCFISNFRICI